MPMGGNQPSEEMERVPSVEIDHDTPPIEDTWLLRKASHYSGLVLASILGTLARLGLVALGNYDGRVIFPLAWAQGVGCGIMGLAAARKEEIEWLYPPLFTFIGTGICGSITTFSSWMLEAYLAFANAGHYHRDGLRDAMDGLAYNFATFAISMSCIALGMNVSHHLPMLPKPAFRKRVVGNQYAARMKGYGFVNKVERTPILDILHILFALAVYACALVVYFVGPRKWRYEVTFGLLLSPPGAMLRYFLARINIVPVFKGRFPMGTFVANMVGTLIIAGAYAVERRPAAASNVVTCNGVFALQQGFCGCLTTVSTFAVEARTIKGKWWSWFYVLLSVVLGQVFVMSIVGGVAWSEGYGPVCTGTK